MANEKEVKAQVRLRFWNVNRHRMTATRNLQVTTKKTGGLTFKTLEGILAKTDVGDDNKVSKRLKALWPTADHLTTAEYNLDQVLGDGRRGTSLARSL